MPTGAPAIRGMTPPSLTHVCPNCLVPLAPSALECASCGADFGDNAAWRPLAGDADEAALLRQRRAPPAPTRRPQPQAPRRPSTSGQLLHVLLCWAGLWAVCYVQEGTQSQRVFRGVPVAQLGQHFRGFESHRFPLPYSQLVLATSVCDEPALLDRLQDNAWGWPYVVVVTVQGGACPMLMP
jgi:hypothetical protein